MIVQHSSLARSSAAIASLIAAAVGCSASAERDVSQGIPLTHDFSPTVVNTSGACDSGQEIYVLARDHALHAFDPVTLTTRQLPPLRCATATAPNSMAVDSEGTAWIGYADGKMFRASPETGECRATSFDGPTKGWTRYGMGFVTERGGRDALFLFDNGNVPSLGLARVDLATEKLVPLGALDELGGVGVELTGRGDGALFGFVSGPPTYVARIDPESGQVASRIDLPLAETGSWAFAHWGGKFFTFTAVSVGHSRVDELVPGRGMKRVVHDLQLEVVGAGVSPCAPTEIR